MGLTFGTEFSSDSTFGLRVGVDRTRLNRLRGDWKTRVEVGRRTAIGTELYQPLDTRQRFFVAPGAGWERVPRDIFVGDDVFARYFDARGWLRLDAGWSFGALGEVRLGLLRDWNRFTEEIGSPALGDAEGDRAGGVLLARFDQVDNVRLPRSGWAARAEVGVYGELLGGDDTYNKVSVNAMSARSFGEWTVHGGFEVAAPFGGTRLPYYDINWLGGFTRLSGLRTGQLYGQYAGLARIGTRYRVSKLPSLIGSGVFVGATLETGNTWFRTEDIKPSNLIWAGSLYGAADTILGPLYLGWGIAERGNNTFFLALGVPL